MTIRFTRHALEKFDLLRRHGVHISRSQVVRTIREPELMDYSHTPLKIAQTGFDKTRVLRVVYREENNDIIIVTFYPGRRNQYGTT